MTTTPTPARFSETRPPGSVPESQADDEHGGYPVSQVEPNETKGLWPRLTDDGADALRDVMTAANGFYYPGDRSDAIAAAVTWLQSHPEACAALGLRSTPEAAATTAKETSR